LVTYSDGVPARKQVVAGPSVDTLIEANALTITRRSHRVWVLMRLVFLDGKDLTWSVIPEPHTHI